MLRNYFNRFKIKWNIDSNWKLFKIMTVFAMAGQSILFTMPFVKDLFGLPNDLYVIWKVLFFVFVSFPIYQIYLLFWAFLLGELQFFITFIKNTFEKTANLIKNTIKK